MGGLRRDDVDLNQPLKIIKKFCKKEAIPILDPRKALRTRHSKVRCYFLYGGHWNAEGVHTPAVSLAIQWRNLRFPPWQRIHTAKGFALGRRHVPSITRTR